MSASERMTGLFIFMFIFNALFGVFAHAFTVFPEDESDVYDYEIAIDESRLLDYGLIFQNASSYNITWKAAPVYFSANEKDFRVLWDEIGILGSHDGLLFQKQSLIEQYADSWLFPERQQVALGETGEVVSEIWNSSIITYWDPEYNWTKIDIASGVQGFITPILSDQHNITKAVYETGILQFTVGQPRELGYSIGSFIDWYWGVVFGFSSYGLPSSMAWIMRLIFSLTVMSFIFMTRALTRL